MNYFEPGFIANQCSLVSRNNAAPRKLISPYCHMGGMQRPCNALHSNHMSGVANDLQKCASPGFPSCLLSAGTTNIAGAQQIRAVEGFLNTQSMILAADVPSVWDCMSRITPISSLTVSLHVMEGCRYQFLVACGTACHIRNCATPEAVLTKIDPSIRS
ncbi:hypothetical protein K402DRAFT_47333 [Aulographum hederae CBS 113979]|uniref:Uncharacterized protein n=1 Tax=Aulographum hederae CBS 113979 TaxID=1176131 RepID=A0A6G1H2V3_9PEZI|nr:hypothetical protein K402DRAFT_47333 [Aulographum hederae CBS 113979]